MNKGIFFLFNSFLTAFQYNSEQAKKGRNDSEYRHYSRLERSMLKIISGFLLVLPMIPLKYKDWVYIAFGVSIISAVIGHQIIDGAGIRVLYLLILLFILLFGFAFYKLLAMNVFDVSKPFVL